MNQKWSEKPRRERWQFLLLRALSSAILVLCFLQLLNIVSDALDLVIPLLGLRSLLSGIFTFQKDRDSAAIDLIVGFVLLLLAASIWLPI